MIQGCFGYQTVGGARIRCELSLRSTTDDVLAVATILPRPVGANIPRLRGNVAASIDKLQAIQEDS